MPSYTCTAQTAGRRSRRRSRAGKFVRFGIRNSTAYEMAEIATTCKHNGWVRPTVYQGMYNVIARNMEPELLVACRRYGPEWSCPTPLTAGCSRTRARCRGQLPQALLSREHLHLQVDAGHRGGRGQERADHDGRRRCDG
ncbi:Aflatoxin B1 aldehyde reductase member 2 [Tolypocladium capitatum]|uniref:Aflatoxin B1 aldehyde reductase member 2 n=1 Tax=Tolypocladium capitatum TaxID=45235 RepID=A0A2K3QCZ6_9HYPO|nr:Aflatoxin B1 aldehyde reductase member 2 [Tolypocladium capitatum]